MSRRVLWELEEEAFATAPLGAAMDDCDEEIPTHREYERDPIGWAVDKLGIPRETLVWSDNPGYESHEWDGTPDPLVMMAAALADWENVGVESATGTGKSYFAAVLVLWFLACFRGARVFTFAVKEDQLRLYIWKEIGVLWPRFKRLFPTADLSDLRIRMAEGSDAWGAWGYSVAVKAGETSATAAQGMHAEHMLLIYEEAPGIHPAVLEAGANTCTAPHNMRLAMGNPDSQDDALHQFCTQSNVRHVTISALDHPNIVTRDASIVPGAVSHKSLEERAAKYGVGSLMYDSRVRGISPAQAKDALIKREWCEAAVTRYADQDFRRGERAWGVDVANSEKGDKGAVARWQGACLLEVESRACPDANQLGAAIVDEVRAKRGRALRVGIDSVGVGAGAVNEAKRLGFYVRALNGGASGRGRASIADDERDVAPGQKRVRNAEQFANLRAAMWWRMREDLRLGRVALPNDPELIADLVTPKSWTHAGKIHVEPKEDIRERLSRSPDKGDAAVYGNWVRDRSLDKDREEEDWDTKPGAMQQLMAEHAEQMQRPFLRRRQVMNDREQRIREMQRLGIDVAEVL